MSIFEEMTNVPDPKYWIASSDAFALYGMDKNDKAAMKRVSSSTATMVLNGIIKPEECQKYKKVRYIKKSAFDRAEVDAAFRYYVGREKLKYPKPPAAEEEPEGTIVATEKYDPQDEALFDVRNFAMSALQNYLNNWEEQVNTIVRRVSWVTRGDHSGIQDILHYLHECVEKDAGIQLARLAGNDSKISVIRKDVRLQYYFLREARLLALKNGIIYLENI